MILDEQAVDIVYAGPSVPTILRNISAGVPSSNIDTEKALGIVPVDNFSDMCFCASCTAVLLAPKIMPMRAGEYLDFIS